MEHVLDHHSQITAQTWWTSIHSCQICSNVILRITRRIRKHLIVQIFRKEMITWHEMWQLCSHTIALLAMRFLSDSLNLQTVGNDIVIFNGNVLGHAWHAWCKNCTNGKRMSSSLLVCHMRIFKLIDFRTIGLWKWITFFLICTVVLLIKANYWWIWMNFH